MKKLLVLFLSALMIVAVLVSCQTQGPDSTETKATVTNPPDTESIPNETDLTDNLPTGLTFDGKSFRMLTYRGGNTGSGWSLYLNIDEPAEGDLLEQAAFQRNADIEDRLHVSIELEDDVFNWNNDREDIAYFMNVIGSAGEDLYDIAILQSSDMSTLLIEELLFNLNQLSYIDWEKPYYIQSMNETYAHGSKRYAMFTDIQYSGISTSTVLVNTDVLSDRGHTVEELYEMVDNGTWTMDAINTLIDGCYRDVNQNGVLDSEDEYGYASNPFGPVYFWPGSGLKGTFLTDDGFKFDYGTDKAFAVMDKVLDFVESRDVYVKNWDISIFQEGRCLFTTWTSELRTLRDWENVKYGILPVPKYEEIQDRYYAVVAGTPLLVPNTITDPEFVGAMIEAMAFGSHKYFVPAFYNNFVQQKVIQDDGSRANWERMMSKWATCELVRVFAPDSGLISFGPASNCITRDDRSYASAWGRLEESMKKICDNYYQYFMKD